MITLHKEIRAHFDDGLLIGINFTGGPQYKESYFLILCIKLKPQNTQYNRITNYSIKITEYFDFHEIIIKYFYNFSVHLIFIAIFIMQTEISTLSGICCPSIYKTKIRVLLLLPSSTIMILYNFN